MTVEEKSNLLNELLEYEENNDIGNLTRAERREFQQWISEALGQQPCEDTVSRESVIEWLKDKDIIKMKKQEENARRELGELASVTSSYNSIKTKLDHVIDEIIIRIEQTRDKDKLCEYPYNRCINIIREKIKNVN
jgi:hypothetical protein